MKKNFFWIFSLVLFSMVVMTSCDTEADACADVVCVNADCFEGECICQVGFVKDAAGDCVPECNDADCVANATCINNECICDIGYERDADNNCVLERDKFLGEWTSSDVCDNGNDAYLITVTAGATDEQVLIRNFYGVFDNVDVVGIVLGTSIVIDRQDPTGEMLFVSGSGAYEAGGVSLSFSVEDPDPSDPLTVNCTAVWSK